MDIINETDLAFAPITRLFHREHATLTLVAKGTFRLVPDGTATPLEPEDLSGDEYEGDDVYSFLRTASDVDPFKPLADLLFFGTAYPPKPAPVCEVTFSVGNWTKTLNVVGDRIRKRKLIGYTHPDPEPFTQMPLTWKNTYGGEGFRQNPVGKGRTKEKAADGTTIIRMQNIGTPGQEKSSAFGHPDPTGFGAVSMFWPQRGKFTGTYNKKYMETHWPGLPEDFDWRFWNAAPEDQQVPYLVGNEKLSFRNLHPEKSNFKAGLPGIRVRAFLEEAKKGKTEVRELRMNLDTLSVRMDEEKMTLAWRTVTDISTLECPEIRSVMIVSEPLESEARPVNEYVALLARKRAENAQDKLEEEAQKTEEERENEEALPEEVPSALRFVAPGPKTLSPALQERIGRKDRFEEEDLSRISLSGLDLSGMIFRNCVMTDVDLTAANLTGADLSGTNLSSALLSRANLSEAILSETTLDNADLSGANLQGALMEDAILESANLAGANLSLIRGKGCDFPFAILKETNFKGADLEEATLEGCCLEKADFSGARLPGASANNAWGKEVNLTDTDLTNARFQDAVLPGAKALRAKGDESVWKGVQMIEADFSGVDLPNAEFSESWLARSQFNLATLPGGRFLDANLGGAQFMKANLMEASFSDADLTGSDFTGANLYDSEFLNATKQGTRFETAMLKMARNL